eukprot:m.289044 g.289044  ORF g.289044 m.289044 type:complete len:140 (+) comp203182_c0_seq1:166-585(+)
MDALSISTMVKISATIASGLWTGWAMNGGLSGNRALIASQTPPLAMQAVFAAKLTTSEKFQPTFAVSVLLASIYLSGTEPSPASAYYSYVAWLYLFVIVFSVLVEIPVNNLILAVNVDDEGAKIVPLLWRWGRNHDIRT